MRVEPSPLAMPRMRPQLHFTAAQGWTNDPHGLVHFGGEYHLFFQYNPAGIVWDKACHWGHATSTDLITWTEQDVALAPQDEIGCWSGSAVVDGEGVVILYTTIRHEDFGRGAVAVARSGGALREWRRDASEDVIVGTPSELEIQGFRDPFVWKSGSGWKALMGAGVPGKGGTALQYSSPDLSSWTFDGPIAQGSMAITEPVWTGSVWECPQLFEIADKWVLLVSAWHADVVHHVAYAIGVYDGQRFEAEQWGRFTHGSSAYASSFFRDAEGRPCVMSWLRELDNVAPEHSPWASAMSLPFQLAMVDGVLQVRHHVNLRSRFSAATPLTSASLRCPSRALLVTAQGQLSTCSLAFVADGRELIISKDDAGIVVRESGGEMLRLPGVCEVAVDELEVSIDADILEITWNGCPGIGSARINAATGYEVRIDGETREVAAMLYASA